MFCSHCGKKVTDTMLFCPFCGEPIVIPDQDDNAPPIEAKAEERAEAPVVEPEPATEPAPAAEPAPEPLTAEPEPTETEAEPADATTELLMWDRDRRSMAAPEPEKDEVPEAFAPLALEESAEPDSDWREDILRRKQAAAPEKKAPQMHLAEGQSAHLDGRAPKLEGEKKAGARAPQAKAHRAANTFVPAKAMNPDDIFMNGKPDAYDAYDDYDDDRDEAYTYEEEDRDPSFFMRHIRGIVGLTLLVILALLFVIYTCTAAGQRSLARMNLAWNTDVYTSLGYEYYQAEQYDQAGLYYERALARAPGKYAHAESAASAYVAAGNTEKAAAMLKKCIEIAPERVEPYVYLLNLYPTAAERPWDITQLIRQGYQVTGDSRLNVEG